MSESSSIHILYMEDDVGTARLFQKKLERQGFRVDLAQDGQEGLTMVQAGVYEVLIVDQNMPIYNGLEVIRLLAAQGPLPPIIMITVGGDERVAVEAVKLGASDYIIKDVAGRYLELLPTVIEQILQRHRMLIEKQQAEAALRESEERYALAARGANDGLWDWNLRSNTIYFSPRWKAMLGYEEYEIKPSPEEWFKRVYPSDLEPLKNKIEAHLQAISAHFEYEYRLLHQDNSYRWMLCRGVAIRDESGQAYRMAGSQTDISARKMAEEQLLHNVFHDALTSLPNRALFMDRLTQALEHTKRDHTYLGAVFYLDLDRFKIINDSLGHAIGDQVLIATVQRLRKCVRPGDTLARLGSDEFTILFDDIKDVAEVTRLAEQIQHEVAAPLNLNNQEMVITVSIGIALSQNSSSGQLYNRAEDLLRDAETAMYQAKALGRGYMVFETNMRVHAVTVLELEAGLRRAIEQQEFRVHYQPIISLTSGQISRVETLLRWQHPQRGLVYPGEFIPLLEETGLIIPVGEWLLRTCCAQIKTWHTAGYGPLQVTVNMSVRQLQEQNLGQLIEDILAETGLAAEALELEVTESVAMQNADFGLTTLNELRAMGLHISIDDFGTGYSSLNRLKQLPINTLKIDQSFIRDMVHDADDGTIISAIIAMGHRLKLKIIAEGVETEEQLAFLREQKCDEVQGYLFSPPIPALALTQLLRKKDIFYAKIFPT